MLFHDDMIDINSIESCINAREKGESVGIIFIGIRLIDGDDSILKVNPNLGGGLALSDFVQAWFDAKAALYLLNTLSLLGDR